jgi:hypothetical protein
MVLAPFREFFPLMFFDGDFDLPQDLLTGIADGGSQHGDGVAGVEIEHAEKIFVFKLLVGVKPAPREQNIGGADHGGISECHPDIEVIILLQEGIFKVAKDVILMVVPILVHQLGGNALQLIGKTVFAAHTVPLG